MIESGRGTFNTILHFGDLHESFCGGFQSVVKRKRLPISLDGELSFTPLNMNVGEIGVRLGFRNNFSKQRQAVIEVSLMAPNHCEVADGTLVVRVDSESLLERFFSSFQIVVQEQGVTEIRKDLGIFRIQLDGALIVRNRFVLLAHPRQHDS